MNTPKAYPPVLLERLAACDSFLLLCDLLSRAGRSIVGRVGRRVAMIRLLVSFSCLIESVAVKISWHLLSLAQP